MAYAILFALQQFAIHFLKHAFMSDETWAHYCTSDLKYASMECGRFLVPREP